jgi:hypothetical protein
MKEPLKEWMSYLFEGANNNFEENLQNIVQAARKEGRYTDFHAGNFGFRPKSDVSLSFDV